MVQTNHDQEIFLEHYRRSNIHYEVLEKMSRKYPSIYPLSNYRFTAAFFLAWFIQSLRSIYWVPIAFKAQRQRSSGPPSMNQPGDICWALTASQSVGTAVTDTTVLVAGSPRSRGWQIWCLVRALFWVTDCQLLCILTWQKGKRAFWGPFYKCTHAIHGGSTLMT